MSLDDFQRQVQAFCFSTTPNDVEMTALKDAHLERWEIYRAMVRARFNNVCEAAFPIFSKRHAGRFRALFSEWLDQMPPSSRYFYEVPIHFVNFALDQGLSVHETDLLRFEKTRWLCANLELPPTPKIVELDFEKTPALNPSVKLMTLCGPVHEEEEEDASAASMPAYIAIFRHLETDNTHVWNLQPLAFTLLGEWLERSATMTASVHTAASILKRPVDGVLIDELSALVAKLLENNILLGSLAPTE